jgi:hypothetical protein
MAADASTEAHFEMTFRDARPPHEIQFHFEEMLLTLFRPSREDSKLVLRTTAKLTGCLYAVELRFDCALPAKNCYTVRVDASWAGSAATYHDYFRNTSKSWFEYWTRRLKRAPPPDPGECPADRYRTIEEQALAAEAHLADVPSIQQAIVSAMHNGARFATAHKEGGTRIGWNGSHFVRADYGESEETETFADEASFWKFLRRFYAGEVSRNAHPGKVSEFDAWKLILRLMMH